ncbi:MAG TPA: amino acid adenylation domain-containing protein [Puia sp.]|nr:amino acid adenylation domain-containing protein [Puia sp.]
MDNKVLHWAIDQVAIGNGSAMAIESSEGNIDYDTLRRRSDGIGNCLQEWSLLPGDVVAVYMDSSPAYVCSIIGINKAGGIFMPIETGYPPKRIRTIIEKTNPRLIITSDAEKENLLSILGDIGPAADEVSLILLNAAAQLVSVLKWQDKHLHPLPEIKFTDAPLQTILKGDDSNYIIYTSGSTGTPKFIEGCHKGLSHFIHWEKKEFNTGKEVRVSQLSPITFDVSLRDIFLPLLSGGTLCIPEKNIKRDPVALLKWLIQHKVTLIHTVPSIFRLLIRAINDDRSFIKGLAGLQHIALAGEALYGRDVNAWRTLLGENIALTNLYGPSETTLAKAFYHIPSHPIEENSIVPLGAAISNTIVFLTRNDKLCLPNQIGEIHIKTPFRSKGYYCNPNLTSEVFIQNPLHNDYDDPVYKTGDLGKYLASGEIVFVGRKDNQVKIRGNRVEIYEVEKVISSFASILQTLVIPDTRPEGDIALVCYLRSDNELDENAIRNYLKDRLPDYMFPSYYVQIPEFPLTLNGKIDVRALPRPEEYLYERIQYMAPRNQTEQAIAEIWKEVLNLKKIGIHHSFFNLGGHSLTATRVVSKIYKHLNTEISLRDFFERPTVAELAELVLQKETAGETGILPLEAAPYYDPSPAQQRLWVLNKLGEKEAAYNLPNAFLLEGPLNTTLFQEAFATILKRHESLRTVFIEVDGIPRQRILQGDEPGFKLRGIDLSTKEDPLAEAREITQSEAQYLFDPEMEPLVRATLLKLAEERFVFVFVLHHIITDGWSVRVLIREIKKIYNALEEGIPLLLPPLDVQYKDYARWISRKLGGEPAALHRSYWQQQLGGDLPVLEMPTDLPRPAVRTFAGRSIDFKINADLTQKVGSFAAQHSVSTFVVVMTALKSLLFHYTGLEDIIIGVPVTGRHHPGLEEQMGLYVNTVALRTRFKGTDTFSMLLGKVKENVLASYAHQDYPFDEVVRDVNVEKDMSRSPLFDIMLVFQQEDRNDDDTPLNGITVTNYATDLTISKFDLVIYIDWMSNGRVVRGRIEYNTDLFRQPTISRFIGHFTSMLDAAISDGQTPVNSIRYISREEADILLKDFNDTDDSSCRGDHTIVSLFEATARRTPKVIALSHEGTDLTYGELNGKANQLARCLREKYGIGPGSIVALCMDAGFTRVAVMLGILKAGGAYLPLNTEDPPQRMKYILENAGVGLVILDSGADQVVDPGGFRFFVPQENEDLIDSFAISDPAPMSTSHDLAYVIYTSGSTGTPKGVMIEHGGVVNRITWMWKKYEFTDRDIVLQKTPYLFDVSVWEFFLTLCFGARLILCRKEVVADPVKIIAIIGEHKITTLHFVPSMLNIFLDFVRFKDIQDLRSLRQVFTSGEALSPATARKYYAILNAPLHNLYGPTEASVDVSFYPVRPGNETIAIGRPISNIKLYIVDEKINLKPIGVNGEIGISGIGLARGYINQEELTAEKFVDNPFETGARIYLTGDRGRWRDDGNIEYNGRIDSQVKLRGIRIEAGEIENTLLKLESIRECAVLKKGGTDDPRLVAYIVRTDDTPAQKIRKFLEGMLPHYMIPSDLIFLKEMPLTPTGKTNRRQLQYVNDLTPAEPGQSINIPASAPALETRLQSLWRGLFENKKVDPDDNFFELGGHSLKALQLISIISKELNTGIELADIFRYPTVRSLTRIIEQKDPIRYEEITIQPSAPYYNLSPAQLSIWILDQFENSKTAYHMSGVYSLEGRLDRGALEKAFQALITRHEMLRTQFIKIDDQPKQLIRPDGSLFRLSYTDLRQRVDNGQIASRLLREEQHTPFSLESDPLIRVKLLHLTEDKYILQLTKHHIVSDAWSIKILIEDVLSLYRAFLRGHENPLPPLRIHYKDYVAWQREKIEQGGKENVAAYWLQRFSGSLPDLNFPTTYPRPKLKTYQGRSLHFTVDGTTHERLAEFSRYYGVTPFMTLFACIKVLIYRYTGQNDLIIGTTVAGRDHIELEQQIGLYVNVLPIRTEIDKSDRFDSVLLKVKKGMLEALEHMHYPFDMLIEDLQLKREPGRSPLFDILVESVNIRSGTTEAGEMDGMTISAYPYENTVSKYDLTFRFREASKLQLELEYNTNLFSESRVVDIGRHFTQLLSGILQKPDNKIISLNYLSDKEKKHILENNRATAVPRNPAITVVSLFEEQALRNASEAALSANGKSMTYGELNEAAGRFAAYLVNQQRIKPGDRIGLLAGPSERAVVALLGILKAGAVFLPLDTANPPDRIRSILDGAGVQLLLIDSWSLPSIGDIYAGPLFAMDIQFPLPAAAETLSPLHLSAEDLAYVIYTSGSTGIPKGVAIRMDSFVNYLLWANEYYYGDGERYPSALFTSLSFDLTLTTIFCTLLRGDRLHIYEDKPLSEILSHIFSRETEINTIKMTPSHVLFLQQLDLPESNIGKIILGGEKLTSGHTRVLRELNPAIRIFNEYGPTETTIGCMIKEVIDDGEPTIGRPIPNLSVYIGDEDLQPLPPGIPGQLLIAGAGLAKGYLHDDLATKSKFVVSPFDAGDGLYPLLYCSGDYGKWLDNGEIEYLGRMDSQVKINGYRIEPAEIEIALLSHPEIQNAAITIREDEDGRPSLLAYVQWRDTSDRQSDLRSFLQKKVPDYMLPSLFITLREFPLTVNGKLDRQALIASSVPSSAKGPVAPPRNTTDAVLIDVWSKVLRTDGIGIHDNFFSLGGDSIRGISIVSAINKQLNSHLELKDLFLYPQLSALSNYIIAADNHQNSAGILVEREIAAAEITTVKERILGDPLLSSLLPVDWEDLYPITDIELGMIFHSRLTPGSGMFHDQFWYQFRDSNFNIDVLQEAVRLLTERHQILRSSYSLTEFGSLLHIVHSSAFVSPELPLLDISNDTEEQQLARIEQYMLEDRNRPFQTGKPGLWRMAMFRLREEEYGILLSFHHAILDGWSRAILMTELSQAYYHLKNKTSFEFKPLAVTYKDYVIDQVLTSQSEETKEFWKKNLAGYAKTVLPLNRSATGADMDGIPILSRFSLGADITEAALRYSQQYSVSLKNIFLAAAAWLIKLTTNSDDIIIGVITHARPDLEDGEKILGCFLNTVPFRATIKENTSGRTLIADINRVSNAMKPYEKLSLLQISRLTGEASAPGNRFFDIMVNYNDFHIYQDSHEETELTDSRINYFENTNTLFDIGISRSADSITYSIACKPGLYKEKEITRIAGYYDNILRHILLNSDSELSSAVVLSRPEQEKLTLTRHDNDFPYPENAAVISLFEQRVSEGPARIALNVKGTTLTYEELNKKANQLAHYLKHVKKIRTGDPVALVLDRSADMLISILAILKAGAAYVPIEPSFPPERILYMLTDSSSVLLLSVSSICPVSAASLPCAVILLDEERETLSAFSAVNPALPTTGDATAYIMYTSGSTGRPKGVIISNKNILSLFHWANMEYRDSTFDVVYGVSSYCFDISVYELLWTLSIGKRLRLFGNGIDILDEIRHDRNILLNTVPSIVDALLDRHPGLGNITVLNLTGEGTPHYVRAKINRQGLHSKMEIRNLYGPTEFTVYATCCRIREEDGEISIGKPISNTSIYILDDNGDLLPQEVTGEIYLSGDGLAQGYVGLPELTKTRFVDNPFIPGKKMYRTGDYGSLREDGTILYLGRRDDQIKIRGQRIETGEIESALMEIGHLLKVKVTTANTGGNKNLAVYYISDQELSVAQFQSFLASKLPAYMIPSWYIRCDHFPLNSNGKIDLAALPGLTDSLPAQKDKPADKATSPTEKYLTDIYHQLFGIENIGIHDDFYVLGGDSIKAIQIASSMHSRGYKLEIKHIYEGRTIAGIAPFAEKTIHQSQQTVVKGVAPLSPIQRDFFLGEPVDRGHYNQSYLLHFENRVDIDILKAVLYRLQEHHDQLRATFAIENGRVIQQINDTDHPLFIELADLRNDKEAPATLEERLNMLQASIDLEKGPLIKYGLFHLPDGDRLSIICHHLIIDTVSWRILLQDLDSLYRHYEDNQEGYLPLKTDSFKLWSGQLAAYAQSPSFLPERDFWAGVDLNIARSCPKDVRAENNLIRDTDVVSLSLTQETTEALLYRANVAFNTGINDLLLTALGLTMSECFDQQQVFLELEGHGREEILPDCNVSRTVGWFTSVYPVILNVPVPEPPSKQLEHIKQSLRSIPHSGIGYGIYRYLTTAQEEEETRRPQISFNYLGQFDRDQELLMFKIADESPGIMQSKRRSRRYELDFLGYVSERRFQLFITYNKLHFTKQTMQTLADTYCRELNRLIRYCEEHLPDGNLSADHLSGIPAEKLDTLFD